MKDSWKKVQQQFQTNCTAVKLVAQKRQEQEQDLSYSYRQAGFDVLKLVAYVIFELVIETLFF